VTHDPIFKAVFEPRWDALPAALKIHYANRPYSLDVVKVHGALDISVSPLMRIFAPILTWAGLMPPYAGMQIPVTVYFRSCKDSAIFCFDRTFYYPGRTPYHFRSQMTLAGGDEVIEFMNLGIGWRAAYRCEDDKVMMQHKGYVWRIYGLKIPMPFHLIFGRGYAFEQAISATAFRMNMEIHHPWFGVIYQYRGTFEIIEVQLET